MFTRDAEQFQRQQEIRRRRLYVHRIHILPPAQLRGQQHLQTLAAKPLNLASVDGDIRTTPRQKRRRQRPRRFQIKNGRQLQQRAEFLF